MELRVLALTAPQFATGVVGSSALTSGDPASLQNACRYAAQLAGASDPVWSKSNWAQDRASRRDTVLLIHTLEDATKQLQRILPRLRPNLVLLGAMSICMAGAVAVARLVREELGDDVLIVLGGRHASETMWKAERGVSHHLASPLALMARGRIPDVFDIVVSGDGESVLAQLGRIVASRIQKGGSARSAVSELDDLSCAEGDWICGTLIGGTIRTIESRKIPIRYQDLISPAEAFGVTARFGVFGGLPTAHVFSDIGRGCIFDCEFCSERISVTGPPRDFKNSPARLFRNLRAAADVIRVDHPQSRGASAFCEDSTLLGWNAAFVAQFGELRDRHGLNIRFGGQATVDQILRQPALASKLRSTGLEYLFIGVETPSPEVVGGFSKDIGSGTWLDRTARALGLLAEQDIGVGISLLFGLGEERRHRDLLLNAVDRWSSICALQAISMNWAVQHPLRGAAAKDYEYIDWPIEEGPLMDVLRNFGEASTRYPVPGGAVPTLEEASDILTAVDQMTGRSIQQTDEPSPNLASAGEQLDLAAPNTYAKGE